MLIIGSHVSLNSKNMLVGSVMDALSYGANTFMFYTGAPQNTLRKPISDFNVEEAKKIMIENGIDINNVIVHAPYIINLANPDEEKGEFATRFLLQEVKRVEAIGCKYLVLHPGSHVGIGTDEGLKLIAERLNYVINAANNNVVILLETMAGKGSEVANESIHIKYLIDAIERKNNIGVCLDTCHLHDSGVNLEYFEEYLDEFDKEIGINYIKCVHINDSKNERGAHKDRHENFGYGHIGFKNLIDIVYSERLKNIPMILETPYIDNKPPYRYEIEMIKNKKFDEKLIEKVKGVVYE